MTKLSQFYINGAWVAPLPGGRVVDVINPATESLIGQISLGTAQDVDAAVAAAKGAFDSYSLWSRDQRIALLEKIIEIYQARYDDMAQAIRLEMGAPARLAKNSQAACGSGHLIEALNVLKSFSFEDQQGTTKIIREPIGVCGFITPWNWPINQIACKVAPALATGCTMVLKPSEVAPLSALLFAEILDEAGVPAGVFNLVNGDGLTVGARLASHPDVDMVSFTGSTGAGIAVAQAAAPTVKRVAQELGGKSANIILDDADIQQAVKQGVLNCFSNSGQSCNAPTRLLVPEQFQDLAIQAARAAAETVIVGNPEDKTTTMGPVVSQLQYDRIQALIEMAIAEKTPLICGGPGKPQGLETGYYVRPTIFAPVTNDMTIAREEVFGPVLSILLYSNEEEAIAMANDSIYGLSGYVSSSSLDRARQVARKLRTGMVHLNGASTDFSAPFGGYKQSGNGREWGHHGFDDFLETKAIMGYF